MEKEIVLITGGDGNIAKEIVRKYLENGSIVIATDIHKNTTNHEFMNNKNYIYYKADVTKLEDLKDVHTKIQEKYGRITHLISAAGRPMKTEIDGIQSVTFEEIEKSINLNLTSHIYIVKIFLDLIENEEKTNKTITLISSINALKSFNLPVYSAAKSGIYGLMKALTKTLGRKNIRINVISPGTVPTKEEIESNGNFYNYRYKEMLALNEFTKQSDIADAVYALTNITKAITGQNIVVDSGQIS